jgi:antibiotic biosynthesis monooxygenase (ABM) superfamily enzyme
VAGSPERRKLLEASAPLVEEFHARVVRTGFEQWFPGADPVAAPAVWKQNTIVLLLLYPVVFLFGLWVQTPLLIGRIGLPFWFALFIGNVISVVLVNWLVPWTSRGFGWWLSPLRDPGGRISVWGGLIVALYAALLLVCSKL